MRSRYKIKTITLTLLLLFILLVSSFFVTTFPPTPRLWPVSVIAICLFFIPVCIGVIQWLGVRQGALLIAGLGIYALIFESIAVMTGLPYGQFNYSDVLGPKIAGIVPFVVFLAWTPLLLGLTGLVRRRSVLVTAAATTMLLVAVDAVLDPAAVGLGFWSWEEPGVYYGVPLINFVGWVISGGIAVTVLELLRRTCEWSQPPRMLSYTLIATIVFWGFVNMFLGHIIPVVLSLVLCAIITRLIITRDDTL